MSAAHVKKVIRMDSLPDVFFGFPIIYKLLLARFAYPDALV